MADMLSSGGLVTAMSLDRSPWVGFEEEAADAWLLPKSDILLDGEGREGFRGRRRRACCCALFTKELEVTAPVYAPNKVGAMPLVPAR